MAKFYYLGHGSLRFVTNEDKVIYIDPYAKSEKGYIENYLDLFNLNNIFLDHLFAGDTLKDQHENLKILKDKYNIKHIIYIGDTKKDEIETLKVDSSYFIYASYGFGNIDNTRYRINSPSELINVVNKIINENNL